MAEELLGFLVDDGTSRARVEQQRAQVRELLRTAPAVAVTLRDADGGLVHWTTVVKDTKTNVAMFLVYVAAKALVDVAEILETDPAEAADLALQCIRERGAE